MMAPRAGMSPAPRTRGSDPRPGRDGASRGSDPRGGGRPYGPAGNGNGNGNGRGGGRPYANGGDPYDGSPPSRVRGQSN
ncbi:MAG TPA: hypothetical protein VJQ45_08230, partial [Ktedonobacterales bacterium]|nr:hypothetical protein [Ktedonobacterales bacterium]